MSRINYIVKGFLYGIAAALCSEAFGTEFAIGLLLFAIGREIELK